MRLLHASDVRQIPLIAQFGLYSGRGRAPLARADEAGEAYIERIVRQQTDKGWPVAVLVFEASSNVVVPAEDPPGIGVSIVRSAAVPPPEDLLTRLADIAPQGPAIARHFREWAAVGTLVHLDRTSLNISATLMFNGLWRDKGILPARAFQMLQIALRPM